MTVQSRQQLGCSFLIWGLANQDGDWRHLVALLSWCCLWRFLPQFFLRSAPTGKCPWTLFPSFLFSLRSCSPCLWDADYLGNTRPSSRKQASDIPPSPLARLLRVSHLSQVVIHGTRKTFCSFFTIASLSEVTGLHRGNPVNFWKSVFHLLHNNQNLSFYFLNCGEIHLT